MISTAGLRFRFVLAVVFAYGFLSSASSESHDQIRELFEWGEYGKLITVLEPVVSSVADTADSARAAEYCYYLGVAKFAQEGVEQSREYFLKAFDLDETIQINRKYIADEIFYLFEATRLEWENKKRMEFLEDSIASVQPVTIEKVDTLLIEKREPHLERSDFRPRILGFSLTAAGVLLGGYSVYEYVSGARTYDKFQKAASVGDKLSYDRYRSSLERSNAVITGCGIASGVLSGVGLFYTFRTGQNKKLNLSVSYRKGTYALGFSY